MTVRAWFTISAIAMAVLAVAFVYRFVFVEAAPPEIIVTAAEGRLDGAYAGSCWPRSGDEVTCDGVMAPVTFGEPDPIAAAGTLRVVVAFPQQPERGALRIVDASGAVVVDEPWSDRLAYDLEAGSYRLEAEARYPADASIRYVFGFVVR